MLFDPKVSHLLVKQKLKQNTMGGRGRPNMQISKYSNEMQMARDDVCRRISTSQFSWLEMINWK